MPEDDDELLVTIGVFGRECGITPSALRFYDDCGLLRPVRVDSVTGYRYYGEGQRERGVLIRRLREMGMPLERVGEVVDGERGVAGRVLDEFVAETGRRAEAAVEGAAAVKRMLGVGADAAVVAGSELAAAVDQVWPAADLGGEIPVLAGVFVEVTAEAVTLTATDRFRLSTRGLVPKRVVGAWAAVVDAGELAAAGSWLRGAGEVTVTRVEGHLVLTAAGRSRRCRVIDERFPDYRIVLAELAAVRTRIVIGKDALLAATETVGPISFSIENQMMRVGDQRVAAEVNGGDIELAFAAAKLRSALRTALGPEVMLDISAADRPVVVRSATDGDLTTLVMPVFHK
ncbi:MerR family transcriptional regulator [Nocardia panacis]|uniref:DNA polymerase III subunit beta family protein n=1 Tax=Nocardia panacis TaxID=2340916 RepID=UPI0013152A5F|nr:MerR family transcriptional regulator [Nocardia panacis]